MFSDRGGGIKVDGDDGGGASTEVVGSHRAVALLSQEGDRIILEYNEARMKRNEGYNRGWLKLNMIYFFSFVVQMVAFLASIPGSL